MVSAWTLNKGTAIILAVVIVAVGFLSGYKIAQEQALDALEYEIVTTQSGVFLLDKAYGGTWKWFVERDSKDEIEDMGWQYHGKPERRDGAIVR